MNPFFLAELRRLRKLQLQRGYHPGWVFNKLKQQFYLSLNDLKLIAAVLGYKQGWAWHQWKAIQEASQGDRTHQNEHEPRGLSQSLTLLKLSIPFTREQLLKAYRRAALLSHPDTGGASEQFIKVNEAYENLKGYLVLSGGAS